VVATKNNAYTSAIRYISNSKYLIIGKEFMGFYNAKNDKFVNLDYKDGVSSLPIRNPLVRLETQ
jgi:hypothetical protein